MVKLTQRKLAFGMVLRFKLNSTLVFSFILVCVCVYTDPKWKGKFEWSDSIHKTLQRVRVKS